MKAKKEHRVPLSPAARGVLLKARAVRRGDHVCPAANAKRPMSNMTLLALLRRMGHTDITVHGFRSLFRDWAAECTSVILSTICFLTVLLRCEGHIGGKCYRLQGIGYITSVKP